MMMTGTIKFYKEEGDFGFIRDEKHKEYFFRISYVKSPGRIPRTGDNVSFSTRPGKKGEEAYDIVFTDAGDAPKAVPTTQPRSTYGTDQKRTPAAGPHHSTHAQGSKKTPPTSQHRANQVGNTVFPYDFAKRPSTRKHASQLKQRPTQLHDHLNAGCYDIAFEVEWQARTPVAANPCSDPSKGTSHPATGDMQCPGYDKRWLMVNGKLAISPFTVKSAVANGFANLLGSCYRVEKECVPHNPDPDTFQCTGAYKRYRVAMDNSKPGLLKSIDYTTGAVEIWPVTEFFWDEPEPPVWLISDEKDNEYPVSFKKIESKGHKKKIITGKGSMAMVRYYGPYRFGMNLTCNPEENFRKDHTHRFYRLDGELLCGRINTLNLQSLKEQKEHVYMGVFRKFNDKIDRRKLEDLPGYQDNSKKLPWHQELANLEEKLEKGEKVWVYYQAHKNDQNKDIITAIGLNFQFKTAFHLHDDAVPTEQQECTKLELLCPRCAMFGMTGGKDKEAVGLRGRFKAATLIGPKVEPSPEVDTQTITGLADPITITLHRWLDADRKEVKEEIARQFLLPIQGQAKANKRQGGYYHQETGKIKGPKRYCHAALNNRGLADEIRRVNGCATVEEYHEQGPGKTDYSHKLRNYAMVCRDGLTFSGVLGAENCTAEEIAALLMLLDHNLGGHGFKIGMGKAIGLGTMTSAIKKIWLRKQEDAPWQTLTSASPDNALSTLHQKGKPGKGISLADLQRENSQTNSWAAILGKEIVDLKTALGHLQTAQNALALNPTGPISMNNDTRLPLRYPPPNNKYWDEARKETRPR